MEWSVLTTVHKFNVLDFDQLFSDVHNQIQVTINMNNKHGKLNNNSTLRNDNNSYSNITNKVNKPKKKLNQIININF